MAGEPREPELWRRTLAAVREAMAAVDTYRQNGGWLPRVKLPSVDSFDSGWPRISSPPIMVPDTAPVEHSALFGPKRHRLRPIAYSDVAAIVELIQYIHDRDDLRMRLTPEVISDLSEEHARAIEQFIELEVANLPLSIMDRARAIGADASSDDQLLALYLERERAWFLDPLPVEYVAPLTLTTLDIDEPLVLDSTSRLEPIDEATHAARASDMWRSGGVPDPVIGAATHALVLSGQTLPNPGPLPRPFANNDAALVPFAEIDHVFEALRVLTSIDVGYSQILRRPLGWADRWKHDLPPMFEVATVRRYPDKFDDFGWLKKPKPIDAETLARLPEFVTSLRDAATNVRLASRRLSLAALREADDDRTVDACIGLEALLGEGRDELSHRLALRAATVLATRHSHPASGQRVYDLMKKVYSHRSAVVHGTSGDKSRTISIDDRTLGAAEVAVLLLRELLTDALTRPGKWTPKTLDAMLLEALNSQNPSE